MAKLLYVMNASLDGYIADEDGKFDWGAPDEEYFSFLNDLLRPVGTYLYGRRLYELMQVWETDPAAAAQSPGTREFAAIWQAAAFSCRTASGSKSRSIRVLVVEVASSVLEYTTLSADCQISANSRAPGDWAAAAGSVSQTCISSYSRRPYR